jgi:hypothetical protein
MAPMSPDHPMTTSTELIVLLIVVVFCVACFAYWRGLQR